jgi:hypothetical protein
MLAASFAAAAAAAAMCVALWGMEMKNIGTSHCRSMSWDGNAKLSDLHAQLESKERTIPRLHLHPLTVGDHYKLLMMKNHVVFASVSRDCHRRYATQSLFQIRCLRGHSRHSNLSPF